MKKDIITSIRFATPLKKPTIKIRHRAKRHDARYSNHSRSSNFLVISEDDLAPKGRRASRENQRDETFLPTLTTAVSVRETRDPRVSFRFGKEIQFKVHLSVSSRVTCILANVRPAPRLIGVADRSNRTSAG